RSEHLAPSWHRRRLRRSHRPRRLVGQCAAAADEHSAKVAEDVVTFLKGTPLEAIQIEMQGHPSGVLLGTIVISLTAFLTVVDLFAIQAILPCLARAYKVMP